MGFTLHGNLILIVDNTAAIDVANNMGVTARTKHFRMAVHYFRDLVQQNSITPIHVFTHFQRADGFTKKAYQEQSILNGTKLCTISRLPRSTRECYKYGIARGSILWLFALARRVYPSS